MPPQDNPQQKNLLIALALSFLVTAVYVTLFAPPSPEGAGAPDGGVAAVAGGADAGVAAAPAPPAPSAEAPAPAGVPEAAPARTLTVQRPQVTYQLSSRGGGLTSAVLQGPKNREQQRTGFVEGWRRFFGGGVEEPPQMDLAVPLPQGPLPLAVSIGGAAPLPADLAYAVAEESAEGVTFRGQSGPWQVTKRLVWPGEGYEFLYTLTVTNTSQGAQTGELTLHNTRAVDPRFEEAPSMLGAVGNQARVDCFVAEDLEVRLPEADEPPQSFEGPIAYFGIDLSYFTSQLFLLDGARPGRCTLQATPTARHAQATFPLSLQPGQSATFHLGGFVGPKDNDLLAAVPSAGLARASGVESAASLASPKLGELVDFGIWAFLAKLLLGILRFFHGLTGNWGAAIILLTVVVKTVLLPLTVKQMASAEDLKKLQPRMEAIRKKYADDRERQQMETLKLYREANVNPLGGCMPLLVQMPVWIALYTALRTSFDIYSEPFLGPVWNDLTYRDPTYIIPVLLGVSMIITQKMQPQMMDQAQARMMTWVLPIVFTFMMLKIPAGLTLYIFTNNLLTVVQQYGLRKWMERRKAAA